MLAAMQFSMKSAHHVFIPQVYKLNIVLEVNYAKRFFRHNFEKVKILVFLIY